MDIDQQFFSFSYPKKHLYDIELFSDSKLLQHHIDNKFIYELANIALTRKTYPKRIIEFLEYQYLKSLPKSAFLKHVDILVKNNEYQFKPNTECIGLINEWINNKFKEVPDEAQPKPSKKNKTQFLDILIKPAEFEKIQKALEDNGYIKDKRWIAEKMDLVAFVLILVERNLIYGKSITTLGRLFCNQFNVEMNLRNFRKYPKADTTLKIERLINKLNNIP
ncbi:MAG: hypothetical protein JNM78_20040 [Cyclobacteriaceae bacterium]|nr:hypothetical protein [Cyclobacteriaceae bacterium]